MQVIPNEIYFSREPRDAVYKHLVDFSLEQCDSFTLVWREDLGNRKTDNPIAGRLAPYLISDTITSNWPGTELLSGSANVCRYKLKQDTAKVIKSIKGLYMWVAPNLPEDPAFYLKSGDLWLGSVTHERMGWLNAAAIPENELKAILLFLYKNRTVEKNYYQDIYSG